MTRPPMMVGWSSPVTIEATGNVGEAPSIAVDGTGRVHVSYYDRTNSNLRYATAATSAGPFALANVLPNDASNIGLFSSIKTDAMNNVHVAWFNSTYQDLFYATKQATSSAWTAVPVDTQFNVGDYPSLVVDPSAGIRIAYHDLTNGDFKYIERTAGGLWVNQTLDATGNVGQFNSIAIDSTDRLHVAYYDVTNGNLKYLSKPNGGAWDAPIIVEATNNVGQYTSIAVDGQGGVHIAYHDVTSGDLKYAYKANNMAFSAPQTLDATNVTGLYTSIAVDSTGRVHIAYQDSTTDDLRYITRPGGSSSFALPVTIESTGLVGLFTSIAVNPANDVTITHFDDTNKDLRMAQKASGASSFTTSLVQGAGNSGSYSQVRYAPNGTLHIAFSLIVPVTIGTTTYQYADLRLAEKSTSASAFTFTTVDGVNTANAGTFIGLAAGANNIMSVTYYDASNGDLRHQHRCP
jgi:hypothetical protein